MKKIDINVAHNRLGHLNKRQVRLTYRDAGYVVHGTLKACAACFTAKGKQKNVKKVTWTKAGKPGERLFADLTGPFAGGLEGNKYWVQVVDDNTRMGFSYFMKRKDNIKEGLMKLLVGIKKHGHETKFIRCDGAGENIKHIKDLADETLIRLELTPRDTPQFNGVVERRIAVLKEMTRAMMMRAGLNKTAQNLLWSEAVRCANTLYNITLNEVDKSSPFCRFTGSKPKLYDHLIEFGRKGYVSTRKKLKSTWELRAQKMIMVGYSPERSLDSYRMFNPVTRKIVDSRDVRWLDWTPTTDGNSDAPLIKDGPQVVPLGFTDDSPLLGSNAPSPQQGPVSSQQPGLQTPHPLVQITPDPLNTPDSQINTPSTPDPLILTPMILEPQPWQLTDTVDSPERSHTEGTPSFQDAPNPTPSSVSSWYQRLTNAWTPETQTITDDHGSDNEFTVVQRKHRKKRDHSPNRITTWSMD